MRLTRPVVILGVLLAAGAAACGANPRNATQPTIAGRQETTTTGGSRGDTNTTVAADPTAGSSPATSATAGSTGATAVTSTTTKKGGTTTTAPKGTTTTAKARTTTPTTAKAVTTTPAPPPNTTGAPVAVGNLGALAGKVIAIDPGHNGNNWQHTTEINRMIFIGTQYRACDTAGTATNAGYSESAHNWDVALRLRAILVANGASVVMSRSSDSGWGPCIDERAYFGNRAHANAAVSIHGDGGPPGGRGFESNVPAFIPGYTDDIYTSSHRLGVDLNRGFSAATGTGPANYYGGNGLIERSDFGGENLSDVPRVLFEAGNMRNATDAALMTSPDFRQKEALGLAQGLALFLAGA